MLVADGFATGREGMEGEEVRERVLALADAGVRLVQLRDHGASSEAFARAAVPLAEAVRQRGAVVLVNTHAETARALGAGLHVGRRGPAVAEARRILPEAPLSAAVHTPAEAAAASQAGADAVVFGPVFPTGSKAGHPGTGLDALAACVRAAPAARVYALGGITLERAGACRAVGAYGVAVLSGLLDAPDPPAAAAAYLAWLSSPPV